MEVNVLVAHVLLEDVGALVVKALEYRAEPGGDEDCQGFLVGGKVGGGTLVLHGLCMDEVGVVVIEDE